MSDDLPPSDPVRSAALDSGHGITLFCPHCDYNLTGLPENRCPECGRVFDPEQLRTALYLMEEEVSPVTVGAAVIHLFWPFWLLLMTIALESSPLASLTLVAVFAGGPISTLILSRRIFARRAKRAGLPFSIVRDRWPIVGVWLLLTALQFALAILLFVIVLAFGR